LQDGQEVAMKYRIEKLSLSFHDLMQTIGYRTGVHDVACPLCGPDRRSPANRRRKVMRIWNVIGGFVSFTCARCGASGYARDWDAPAANPSTYARVRAEIDEYNRAAAAARLGKALVLWRNHQPLRGSIAETYLRDARGYRGPLPPTLGFLPARGEYPPAMIAAFGLPEESEPGAIAIPEDRIAGVHFTRLVRDGSDRERYDKSKIMTGFSRGSPIVVAPWTDGHALVATEGIEDALSAHEATGLCAWAAGSASRAPALADAVPSWVASVTILADDDRDGRRHASSLAAALSSRNVEIRLIVLGAAEISAA
jgi:Toprim domain